MMMFGCHLNSEVVVMTTVVFVVRKAMSDLALDLNAVDLTSYPSALHLI